MQIRIKGTEDEIKRFIKATKDSPYVIYNSSPVYPSRSGNLYRCYFEVLEMNPANCDDDDKSDELAYYIKDFILQHRLCDKSAIINLFKDKYGK